MMATLTQLVTVKAFYLTWLAACLLLTALMLADHLRIRRRYKRHIQWTEAELDDLRRAIQESEADMRQRFLEMQNEVDARMELHEVGLRILQREFVAHGGCDLLPSSAYGRSRLAHLRVVRQRRVTPAVRRPPVRSKAQSFPTLRRCQ